MRLVVALAVALIPLQDKDKGKKGDPATSKEAMQRIQLLIGEWNCTGESQEGKQEMWTEKCVWSFKIDKEDYSLEATYTDSKRFKSGLLTYDLTKKSYKYVVTPTSGDKKTFEGPLAVEVENKHEVRKLVLDTAPDSKDADKKQDRMVFSLLRDNRILIALLKRSGSAKEWTDVCDFGCTKQGVPFVKGGGGAVCIITGGTPVTTVSYKGKTYYFC